MNAREEKQYYNSIVRCNIRDLPGTFDVDKDIKILYIAASIIVFIDTDGNPYKINIPIREGWSELGVGDVATVRRTLSYGTGQHNGIVYGVLNIQSIDPATENTTVVITPTVVNNDEELNISKALNHLRELAEEAKQINDSKRRTITELLPGIATEKDITDDLVDLIIDYIEEDYKEIELLDLDKEEEIFFNRLLYKKILKKLEQ